MTENLNDIPIYDGDRGSSVEGIFGKNGEILFFILIFLFLFFNGFGSGYGKKC